MIDIILGESSVMVGRVEDFKNKNVVWLRESAKKGNKSAINELIMRAKSGDKNSMEILVQILYSL